MTPRPDTAHELGCAGAVRRVLWRHKHTPGGHDMNIEILPKEQQLPTRDYNRASVAVLVERTDTPGEFHVATATIHYGAGRAIPDGSVIVKAANMLSARSIAIDGTRWGRESTVLGTKDFEVHIYRHRGR